MKIIGHRGAAGLALENSLESLRAGVEAGADALEIDVRLTRDEHLVLSHDPSTEQVADRKLIISSVTLAQLKKLRLRNGESWPTLEAALLAVPQAALVIEGKEVGWAEPLAKQLSSHARRDISVISFNHDELKRFHDLLPSVPTFALESIHAFGAIRRAARDGFAGVDTGFWLLNPFTYLAARRRRLDIIVYTVDWPWLVAYFTLFFPQINLTTNVPNKLQRFRSPSSD
jgi:glycerophosphoryl diester phosphodiesterase